MLEMALSTEVFARRRRVVTYTAGWDLHGGGEALLRLGAALGDAWVGSCQCLDVCGHWGPLTGGDGERKAKGDGNSRKVHDG